MRPRNGLACLDLSLHWYIRVAARRLLRMQFALGLLMAAVIAGCAPLDRLEWVIFLPLLVVWLTQGWYVPAVGQLLFDGHPKKADRPSAKKLLIWTLQELVLLVAFGVGSMFVIVGVPLMALSHVRAPLFFLERQPLRPYIKRWGTLAGTQGGLMLTTWFWGTAFRFWCVLILIGLAYKVDDAFNSGGWFGDEYLLMRVIGLCGAVGLWLTGPWWACLQVVTYVHARIATDCWDLQVGALQAAAELPALEETP
jgi:hypothetical protein